MSSVKVAAIQVQSKNGAMEENLANAAKYVTDAAAQGAKLALCPEFLTPGYIFEESIWDSGERQDGPTESSLRELSRRLGIYVGAGYLETDGKDFFNTFTLMAPGGKVAGRVRKGSLPAFEGWYFKPDQETSKVIETEIGRIGVGICNDNNTCWFLQTMTRERPDILLMPHSAPSPTPPVPILGDLIKDFMRRLAGKSPIKFAKSLGIPVVYVNKTGSRTVSALPLIPWMRVPWEFQGLSYVCDGEGRVLAQLGAEEGAAVAEVTPGALHEPKPPEPDHFYWSFEPPSLADASGRLLLWLEEKGKASYNGNPRRKAAARRYV